MADHLGGDFVGTFESAPGFVYSVGVDVNPYGAIPAPPDTTSPIINAFSPSTSTPIGRFQHLQFDVTDNDALAGVFVFAVYATGAAEVVYDGSAFAAMYASSARTEIAGGYRFVVRRVAGWPASVTLKVRALDMRGNAA